MFYCILLNGTLVRGWTPAQLNATSGQPLSKSVLCGSTISAIYL